VGKDGPLKVFHISIEVSRGGIRGQQYKVNLVTVENCCEVIRHNHTSRARYSYYNTAHIVCTADAAGSSPVGIGIILRVSSIDMYNNDVGKRFMK